MSEYNKNNGQMNRNNNNEYNTKPAPQVETTPCVCEEKGILRNIADKTTSAVKSLGNAFHEAPVKTTAIVLLTAGAATAAVKAIGYTVRQIKAHGANPKNWDKPQINLNPFKKKGKGVAEPAPEAAPAEQPAE